jgi:hypothetical protein
MRLMKFGRMKYNILYPAKLLVHDPSFNEE